eukprot:CAMPEP_0172882628 /NCGR_PEP_ID=MMETSP1075-20121228/120581_1 /TAXON_ID=2916 /ORGANISM="Ceratium fusus, Strain PA161109" /LENGTH=83 /DNA_ID=CAMNT_0013735329 /DNA_START=20 /DNA_END=267 /DNA_ORIENTATION=-
MSATQTLTQQDQHQWGPRDKELVTSAEGNNGWQMQMASSASTVATVEQARVGGGRMLVLLAALPLVAASAALAWVCLPLYMLV